MVTDLQQSGLRAELLISESLISELLNQQPKLDSCLVELEPAGLDNKLPSDDKG